MNKIKIMEILAAMAEIHGRNMSDKAIKLFLMDLENYREDCVLKALERCRKELPRFPTLSDIITRIDDGRPGADEAWAMVPKSEQESVVWTEEMAQAYLVCAPLIGEDNIAARMAFKQNYEKAIAESRANFKPAKWVASFGFDKNHRISTLIEAIEKGRISTTDGAKFLPALLENDRFLELDKKPKRGQMPEIIKSIVGGSTRRLG
jgi:hypothetical protein